MRIKHYIIVVLIACIFALPGTASAEERNDHAQEHGGQIFHAFRLEAGGGTTSDGAVTVDWDFDGWIGTDENKLWLKSEGERTDSTTEQAELWALYSRNIATFWDIQAGIRYDVQPQSTAYLAIGFEGLAPYFFETEAHLFFSEDGDVSLRLRQENDFLITQRLITQPYLEANLFAQDVAELGIGVGIASAEIGIQTRYEFTRKFAPYLDIKYERKFGETSSIAKNNGEDNDALIGTIGLRTLF